jgi:hypothetical protein
MPSLSQLNKLRAKAARLQASSKRVREKAGEVVANAVSTAEVSAASFGWGYASKKFGKDKMEIGGLSYPLLAGTSLHILSFMGVGGKAEDHMRSIGDGCLAAYFYSLGEDVAVKGGVSGYGAAGYIPGHRDIQGQMLEEDELADILENY